MSLAADLLREYDVTRLGMSQQNILLLAKFQNREGFIHCPPFAHLINSCRMFFVTCAQPTPHAADQGDRVP